MSENNALDFDLDLLKVLAAALNQRSVTRAGRELGVTQSAASHALRRLRSAFGDELLVRVGNRLVLTERGQALRPRVNRLLSEIADLVAAPAAFDPSASFPVTIAATAYAEVAFVPPLMRLLAVEAPSCQLRIRPLRDDDLEESLLSASIDLAIGRPLGELPAIKRRLMATDEHISCVSKSHPLATKRRITLQDFVSYPHVTVSTPGRVPSAVDRALERLGYEREVGLRVGHFLAGPIMVLGSDCILTSHRTMLEPLARELSLHLFATPLRLAELKIHMFWHTRDDKDAKNRWLRSLLWRAAQATGARRGGSGRSGQKKSSRTS